MSIMLYAPNLLVKPTSFVLPPNQLVLISRL
jgi:hypothetical protein